MNVNKESEMIQEQQEKKQAQSEAVIGLLTNRGILPDAGIDDEKVYSFTDVGNWDEYGEYVNKILSGSLYQTEMGKQIGEELEKNTPEEFFRKYQFLTLSTCRSWVGRDARLLVVAARKTNKFG